MFLCLISNAAATEIDLSHWNLTLPTGVPAKPDIVPTSQLMAGYTSEYFYRDKGDALIFWCPVTGETTKGTHYPRTELRETTKEGKLYNWHASEGHAVLKAELTVTQVPGTGRLTVGQIHDDGKGGIKSEPLLKLVYKYSTATQTGDLVAQVRSTPTAPKNENHVVAKGLKFGERFSYKIELDPDLELKVDINGKEVYSEMVDHAWDDQGLYFKAGSYLEDNAGSSADGGRVTFYTLTVHHQ